MESEKRKQEERRTRQQSRRTRRTQSRRVAVAGVGHSASGSERGTRGSSTLSHLSLPSELPVSRLHNGGRAAVGGAHLSAPQLINLVYVFTRCTSLHTPLLDVCASSFLTLLRAALSHPCSLSTQLSFCAPRSPLFSAPASLLVVRLLSFARPASCVSGVQTQHSRVSSAPTNLCPHRPPLGSSNPARALLPRPLFFGLPPVLHFPLNARVLVHRALCEPAISAW